MFREYVWSVGKREEKEMGRILDVLPVLRRYIFRRYIYNICYIFIAWLSVLGVELFAHNGCVLFCPVVAAQSRAPGHVEWDCQCERPHLAMSCIAESLRNCRA